MEINNFVLENNIKNIVQCPVFKNKFYNAVTE